MSRFIVIYLNKDTKPTPKMTNIVGRRGYFLELIAISLSSISKTHLLFLGVLEHNCSTIEWRHVKYQPYKTLDLCILKEYSTTG
jgi:hypothetical protein